MTKSKRVLELISHAKAKATQKPLAEKEAVRIHAFCHPAFHEQLKALQLKRWNEAGVLPTINDLILEGVTAILRKEGLLPPEAKSKRGRPRKLYTPEGGA